MYEGTFGQIMMVAFNFAPQYWAFCNGQLINITDNTALFSLLGTYYGGDGVTNFALPDFRSRVPIGAGQGNGLSSYNLGQASGLEGTNLTVANLPPAPSVPLGPVQAAAPAGGTSVAVAAQPVLAGSGLPFSPLPPSLAVNFVICTQGYFPSRS